MRKMRRIIGSFALILILYSVGSPLLMAETGSEAVDLQEENKDVSGRAVGQENIADQTATEKAISVDERKQNDIEIREESEIQPKEEVQEENLEEKESILGQTKERAIEEEKVINVALPSEFKLKVDPLSLSTNDPDTQITSPVYEIANYGNVDVVIDVLPAIVSRKFELIDEKPEAGTDLVSTNAEKAKALFLEMQIADNGKKQDILRGEFTFKNKGYDLIMSKMTPAVCQLLLEAADEEGNPVEGGKSAFRFRGNVDPRGEYHDGELEIQVVFAVHELPSGQVKDWKKKVEKEKLNYIGNEER